MLGGLHDWRFEESSAEETATDDDGENDGDSPAQDNLMSMDFDSSEDDYHAGRSSRGRRISRREQSEAREKGGRYQNRSSRGQNRLNPW